MKADDFAFRPVGLSNKAWDESGAQHNRAFAGSATIRAKARIVAAGTVDGESSPPPPDPALQIFGLRETEANAPDVLRLIATRDLDWATLYKVLEIIQNDVGGDKAIAELGWASRKRLGVFTTSANHPEASGDDARHARMKGTPTDTMTLAEGRAFLQSLVQAWLQWLIAGRPPPT
jgi:hypothetical protein